MKKKLLSVILAAAMLASLMYVPASAKTEYENTAEAVNPGAGEFELVFKDDVLNLTADDISVKDMATASDVTNLEVEKISNKAYKVKYDENNAGGGLVVKLKDSEQKLYIENTFGTQKVTSPVFSDDFDSYVASEQNIWKPATLFQNKNPQVKNIVQRDKWKWGDAVWAGIALSLGEGQGNCFKMYSDYGSSNEQCNTSYDFYLDGVSYNTGEKTNITDKTVEFNADLKLNEELEGGYEGDHYFQLLYYYHRGANDDVARYLFEIRKTGENSYSYKPKKLEGASSVSEAEIAFETKEGADGWFNLKYCLDTATGNTKAYINGELLYEQENSGFGPLCFFNLSNREKSVPEVKGDIYTLIDNVEVNTIYDKQLAGVKAVKYVADDLTSDYVDAGEALDPVNIRKIEIAFSEPMDENTLSNIKIKDKNGDDVDTVKCEYDAEEDKYVLELQGYLESESKYKINVPTEVKTEKGDSICAEYLGELKTGKGGFAVKSLKLNKNGASITADASFINMESREGSCILGYSVLRDNIPVGFDYKEIPYKDGEFGDSILISDYREGDKVQAVLFESFGDMTPMIAGDEISPDKGAVGEGDYTVKLSVSLDESLKGKTANIAVFNQGKTESDLSSGVPLENAKVFLYIGYSKIEENGECPLSFCVNEDTKTGQYSAEFYTKDGKTTESFVFANPNDIEPAIDDLNDGKLEEKYDEIKYSLGLTDEYFEGLNQGEILKLLSDSAKSDNVADLDEVSLRLQLATVVSMLNNSTCDNIFDAANSMDAEKTLVKDEFANGNINADVQKAITAGMSGKNLKSIDEFYECLTEEFIVASVNDAQSYKGRKEIIIKYKGIIGVETDGVRDSVYSDMPSSYSSLEDIKEQFEKFKKKGSGTTSGGSSGGGGTTKKPTISGEIWQNVGTSSTPEELNRYVFDDIENVEWAKVAICTLAEKGIVTGKELRRFYPDDNVKREEFVKMIIGAFGSVDYDAKCDFSDVDKDAWYYSFVATAFTKEIVKGYGDTFGIGREISREDLAVMAYNAAKEAGINFNEYDGVFKFADDEEISDYAKEAVYTLQNEGIISGMTKKTFAPKNSATRAQAAKILFMIYELAE